MPVRLLRPYANQAVNTLYWGSADTEDMLRATGNADDRTELASNYAVWQRTVTGSNATISRNALTYFMNSSSAQTLNLGQTGYWQPGQIINVVQMGSAATTVVPATGVTISGSTASLVTGGPNTVLSLEKAGANSWIVATGSNATVSALASVNRSGIKWCTIGDSITDHNSVRPNTPVGQYGGTAYSETIGWMPWFVGLANSPQVVWDATFDNFGVSGDQTTDVLARMPPILSGGYDVATLLIGTNDISSGIGIGGDPVVVLANLKANYLNILGQLRAANIRPIVFTLLPRGDATGATTATRLTLLSFNSWLRGYAAANDIELFDSYSIFANPASATGGEIAGTMFTDHIHPNATGAMLMGQALYTQFQSRLPKSSRLQNGALDVYDATNNNLAGNLLAGAQFFTTSAMPAISPLTTSGVIPAGFTITRAAGTGTTGTVAGSVVADPDGNGNWFRLDFTSLNGTTEVFQIYEFITSSKLATGDIIESWGQVEQITGSTGGALNELSWTLSDSSGTTSGPSTVNYIGMAQGTNAGTIPTTAFVATWPLPKDQIQPPNVAGTYTLRMIGKVSISVSSSYTGAVRFRLPTCRKKQA